MSIFETLRLWWRDDVDIPESEDFDENISIIRAQLDENHRLDNRLALTDSLASNLWQRFNRDSRRSDLDDYIGARQSLIELSPDSPFKPWILCQIALAQNTRWTSFNDRAGLDASIQIQRDALELLSKVSEGEIPERAKEINKLGSYLKGRWKRDGNVDDLDEAVTKQVEAAEILSLRPEYLCDAASALCERYENTGIQNDLSRAIEMLYRAVELPPSAVAGTQMAALQNLGTCLRLRFELLGKSSDLADGIEALRGAVEVGGNDPKDRAICLQQLGLALQTKYITEQRAEDINEMLAVMEQAVNLCSTNPRSLVGYLNIQASGYFYRYERMKFLPDLDQAINISNRILSIAPEDHPELHLFLGNSGVMARARFERLGERDDLNRAIAQGKKAVKLVPITDPAASMQLLYLGMAYHERFRAESLPEDIDKAISLQTRAGEDTRLQLYYRAQAYMNCGNSFAWRFEKTGDLEDLHASIRSRRQAIDILPPDHASFSPCVDGLGCALRGRYLRLQDPDDIDASIDAHQQAVDKAPDGSPVLAIALNNLACAYETRRQTTDLNMAIVSQNKAVTVVKEDNPDYPAFLANLGRQLCSRFERTSESKDLDSATKFIRQALQATPENHQHHPKMLAMLARSYLSHFYMSDSIEDLDQGIRLYREAIGPGQQGIQRVGPDVLFSLAHSLQRRYSRTREHEGYLDAISIFKKAAYWNQGSAKPAYAAAYAWAEMAREEGDVETALEGFERAVSLLPQLTWVGMSQKARRKALTFINLSCDAAACAIESGKLEKAVELLEEGRSVLWNETARLRADVSELSMEQPELALKVMQTGRALEGQVLLDDNNMASSKLVEIEARAQEKQRLALEWEQLLQDVRSLPEFSNFLKPTPFHRLRRAAVGGTIVIIIVHWSHSNAIFVAPESKPRCIELPKLDAFLVKKKADALRQALTKLGSKPMETQKVLVPILRWLWETTMEPILKELGLNKPAEESESPPASRRLWLCPTSHLTFLPLHAAGPYAPGKGKDASRLAIISYTTTLSALLRARGTMFVHSSRNKETTETMQFKSQTTTTSSSDHQEEILDTIKEAEDPSGSSKKLTMALVSYDAASGDSQLLSLSTESSIITKLVTSSSPSSSPSSVELTQLEGESATATTVSQALKRNSWIHLSCHGKQKATDPLASFFQLYKSNLELREILKSHREAQPKGEKNFGSPTFAYLAACQTAVGDANLPDESTHLAAGMQYAGFRSLVGTMWSIRDDLGPSLAGDIYGKLTMEREDGEEEDWEARGLKSAEALNQAVDNLRERLKKDKVKDAFCWWVPFIHIGA